MPDLLAHALVAYSLATLLSWRYEWLTPTYVTVVMAGAFIPDLTKISLVVSDSTIESLLGFPFDWFALHTLGGTLVSLAIGVVLVASSERKRVAVLLGVGAASHLFADALLRNPSGRSYAVFWPFSYYHPPTPGLYLSTDPLPTVVAAVVATAVFVATRRRRQRTD